MTFANTVVFVASYLLLMTPTYVLPYFGSNSALFGAMAAGMTGGFFAFPLFWLHTLFLFVLCVVVWARGTTIGKGWLPVLPTLAAFFDLMPGFNWIPLVPTGLHVAAVIAGTIHGQAQTSATMTRPALRTDRKLWTLAAGSTVLLACFATSVHRFAAKPPLSAAREAGAALPSSIPEAPPATSASLELEPLHEQELRSAVEALTRNPLGSPDPSTPGRNDATPAQTVPTLETPLAATEEDSARVLTQADGNVEPAAEAAPADAVPLESSEQAPRIPEEFAQSGAGLRGAEEAPPLALPQTPDSDREPEAMPASPGGSEASSLKSEEISAPVVGRAAAAPSSRAADRGTEEGSASARTPQANSPLRTTRRPARSPASPADPVEDAKIAAARLMAMDPCAAADRLKGFLADARVSAMYRIAREQCRR